MVMKSIFFIIAYFCKYSKQYGLHNNLLPPYYRHRALY